MSAHDIGRTGLLEPSIHSSERWVSIALALVAGTMVYNVIEAVVALWSGVSAESVALVGFGLDSVIETAAAALLLWRLLVEARGAGVQQVADTERRVRWFVGLTFLLLALYVVAQAGTALWIQHVPDKSLIGIVLAVASLVLMPILSVGKLRGLRLAGESVEITILYLYFWRESAINLAWPMNARIPSTTRGPNGSATTTKRSRGCRRSRRARPGNGIRCSVSMISCEVSTISCEVSMIGCNVRTIG